jgi:hypothetical protein
MEFIKKNFLAVCILLSAFLLSIAIIFSALCSRYYYVDGSLVFDKLTGDLFISRTVRDALKED